MHTKGAHACTHAVTHLHTDLQLLSVVHSQPRTQSEHSCSLIHVFTTPTLRESLSALSGKAHDSMNLS